MSSFWALSVRAPRHFTLQHILVGVPPALPPPQSGPLQAACPPGKKDEACHLLVCAEGEMTFERRAKCECTLHSCAAVRSDHCYSSCPSSGGATPPPSSQVVRIGAQHPPSLLNLIRGAVIAACVRVSTIVHEERTDQTRPSSLAPPTPQDSAPPAPNSIKVYYSVSCCHLGM